MKAAPRVSFLMAVCDGETYLDQAIQSVLSQTFRDFEFIVINDGSTDGTAKIIERYQRTDGRICAHEQPHLGLVGSLNRGLELARGEYVARMDADDISLPERIAKQMAFMDAHQEVGICGTWIETFGNGGAVVRQYPADDATIRSWLLFESVLAHPSIMMRRERLVRAGLSYDAGSVHAEDYDLWVRAARHMVLANIPEVFLRYRLHPQQVVQKHEAEKLASAGRVRLAQLEFLGIRPTEDEFALHHALSTWQFRATQDFIGASLAWLHKLKTANDVAGIYQEKVFLRVLGQRWAALCATATPLGLWTLKTFQRTPLSVGAGLTWKQMIKFAVKCGIKRRVHG
ncbi:MAG: glycosyltransferase [Nitrospiraceae bacterium]|nr:MAG: glycosyltransferase [Nitrospiraceae bacterium]